MRTGSLFSGIGGMDLGFERAGFEIVFQCEIDPFCRRVLAKHWPGIPCYEDVRNVSGRDVPGVDIIIGGFPCQPHSSAGKRLGVTDERFLWPEFARLIEETGPRLVVIENVPGLRYSGLRTVLSDLARLGFDAEWSDLSACAMGAPHMRRRLFVVAYANGFNGGPGFRDRLASALGEIQAGGFGAVSPADERLWREDPSSLYRVVDGVPDRLDRVRTGGGAVLPRCAEVIARAILEASR